MKARFDTFVVGKNAAFQPSTQKMNYQNAEAYPGDNHKQKQSQIHEISHSQRCQSFPKTS
ncbi:hypothetical protein JS562_47510 [Agrobacterium sp. S2]|nr:hypothetical protein [Agrobacterium sp. S2]